MQEWHSWLLLKEAILAVQEEIFAADTEDIHLVEDIPIAEKEEAHTIKEGKVRQEVINHPAQIHQMEKANIQDQAVTARMAVEEVIQAAGEAIVLAEDLDDIQL